MPSSADTGILRKLERILVPEIDPFVIGLFRIALGIFLAVYYFCVVRDWETFYGVNGLHYPEYMSSTGWPTAFAWVSSEIDLWRVWGVSFTACLLLIFGLGGKLPVIWLWMMNYGILWRNLASVNSEEQIMSVVLFFAMFLPLNSALALGLKNPPAKVRPIGLVPLQINMALVYAISVPWKFKTDPAWVDGSAVYFATRDMLYARWPYSDLYSFGNGLVSRALSFWTLFVESTFPLLVWFRRFRLPWACFLIILHSGIGIFLSGVTFFSFGMVVGLISFLPSGRMRRIFEGLRARATRGRTPANAPSA